MPSETHAIPEYAVRLLRKVEQHISQEPARYKQTCWMTDSNRTPCGTAACIAGWVVALHRSESENIQLPIVLEQLKHTLFLHPFHEAAAEALQIPREKLASLFSPTPQTAWPEPFRTQWTQWIALVNRAFDEHNYSFNNLLSVRIAVDRIEHFIRTGE